MAVAIGPTKGNNWSSTKEIHTNEKVGTCLC